MRTLWSVVLCCVPCQAATITVNVDGGADYTDIQSAIDAASDGDTVLVGPGLYVVRASIDFNRLYDHGNPAGPPLKNIVVRSAAGAEATTILRDPEPTSAQDKVNAVVFENGEDAGSQLIGFRVTGQWPISGDGVLCANRSSPTIADCVLSENIGNGITCVDYSSPAIRNCTIPLNFDRGVSCVNNCAPRIADCVISQNGGVMGGGVFCKDNSAPIIRDCTIASNFAAQAGGAVFCYDSSTPEISGCRVWGNLATEGGGIAGGAIVTNCTITGNLACAGGAVSAGLFTFGRYPRLINCTIAGNRAPEGMGGLPCGLDGCFTADVVNCIIWGNTPESLCNKMPGCSTTQDPLFISEGAFDFSRMPYVAISGGQALRPDFIVEPPDFRLRPGSPAIDIADPSSAPDTDIEGNARPCWSGVDMGAHEYCGGAAPARLPQFKRGDVNASGARDIADGIFVCGYLFAHGPAPACLDTTDANDDGKLNVADVVALLGHLFAHTGPLPQPSGSCGIDPTSDDLDCGAYPPCEGP